MARPVGIDLGTTYSALAICDEQGRPAIVRNREGQSITPSVVAFENGQFLVGDSAKELLAAGETNIALLFKRQMGNPDFKLELGGKTFTAIDLSALVLGKLKADAQDALGIPLSEAIITVPAYFDNARRQATVEAGRRAGLKVLRTVNEPTAAALAFGFGSKTQIQTVLVYDLGGGTFDVTLVRLAPDAIDVIGSEGDAELGGKDWDDRLIAYLAQEFESEFGCSPASDLAANNDLRARCEKAKYQLTSNQQTQVTVAYAGNRGSYTITRETFERLTQDLVDRCLNLAEQTLTDAKLAWTDLDGVVLVGGSTRMPMIGKSIEVRSGRSPLRNINPDEAVALGAAIQTWVDDAAARPTFALGGTVKKVTDVTPHSLGMVAINHDRSRFINSIIIPKNRPIPRQESQPYTIYTHAHAPNITEIYMLQGEAERPLDCMILGRYVFSGIRPEAGGSTVIDIQYAYDISGIVKVSAMQRDTGQQLNLEILPLPDDLSWLDQPPANRVTKMVPHLKVIMAFDVSGSMSGRPIKEARRAASGLISRLDLAHVSVGLIAFSDDARLKCDLCQNARQLESALQNIKVGETGGGNSSHPFTLAHGELQGDEPRFLIVLTDGVWSDQPAAIKAAKHLQSCGVETIAIGFGGADSEFLRQIASSSENALFTDLSKLHESFCNIAQVMTQAHSGLAESAGSKRASSGRIKWFG